MPRKKPSKITPHALYGILLLAAGCTSFYMFRLYFLVFHGKFRGTHEEEHHLHESPPAMTIVLWILAIGSIVSGFVGIPEFLLPEKLAHYGDYFGHWLRMGSKVAKATGGAKAFGIPLSPWAGSTGGARRAISARTSGSART